MSANLETRLKARDTAAGRRYEVKIVLWDCSFLCVGCVGLALWFPPLIYAAAVGHLTATFLASPVKWFWAVSTAITTGIATGLLVVGSYAAQTLYHGTATASVTLWIGGHWPQLLATAVTGAGIIGTLAAYPGNLDQLRDHLDQSET